MITLDPSENAKFCCIVLHGLGADGNDLVSLVPSIWPRADVRWVFPDAPVRPITINGGLHMRGWYDVLDFDRLDKEDETGVRDSCGIIERLIEDETKRGFSRTNIVLMGFSQGGAMSLFTGLRQPSPLCAIIGLSCALPLASKLEGEAGARSRETAIFIGAGESDEIVKPEHSKNTAKFLEQLGYKVEHKCYKNMGHAISEEEIGHAADFLIRECCGNGQ